MKVLCLIMFLLPISCFSQSDLEIDTDIDSLKKSLIYTAKTDLEKQSILSQLRKLKRIKDDRKIETKIVLPNLDSIDQKETKQLERLWEISMLPKISIWQRDSLYNVLYSGQKGLSLLIDNIDYYKYDWDNGSEELNNYPVFAFLASKHSSAYFDYLDKLICEDSEDLKLQLLLWAALNGNFDKETYRMIIHSYLDRKCLNKQNKLILEMQLEYLK